MDINAGWIGLVVILFVTSFGLFWCVVFIVGLVVFVVGVISLLYLEQGDIDKFYRKCTGNPLTVEQVTDGGLKAVVKLMISPRKKQKTDNRVTGSDVIDSSLQEILGYIIRDYINPWYNLISADTEFTEVAVKETAQTLAINISNRIKDIDWIPYLTTRLVDDAASHLRLFKQARARLKIVEKQRSPKNSPQKDSRLSPKRTHKRNKSETDVWYYGNRNIKESDRNVRVLKSDSPITNLNSLEANFFELECQMENYMICRDSVCMDANCEREFLSELIEILLYVLLPDSDFQCKPLRIILRELFANSIVLPLFVMVSDPDYINQAIIWLCLREASPPSDIFLTTLRLTEDCDELKATKDIVSKEIQVLRSRDSGGDSDFCIKQQLNSLVYVLKLVNNRLSKLESQRHPDEARDLLPLETAKTINLPLDIILKNNVALSYFIDYVTFRGKQAYLFFYLNVEAWKASTEQQLANVQINKMKGIHENVDSTYENIRSAAIGIFNQYLGDKSEQKIEVSSTAVQSLCIKLRSTAEPPSDLWFDEIQSIVYEMFKTREDFLPTFRKSHQYIKLLGELDLLQQNVEEDNISLNSVDSLEINNVEEKQSLFPEHKQLLLTHSDSHLCDAGATKGMKHVRSLSDVTCVVGKTDLKCVKGRENGQEEKTENGQVMKSGSFILSANIIQTGIVCEKGKTFGIYAIRVSVQYDSGYLEEWHVYRRYSDFYDLHSKIKDKFPDLAKLAFPGKKTFHNMDRAVLERRMKMLGIYLQELCQSHVISSHPGLQSLLMTFLEQGDYDRAALGGVLSNTIDTIVNPLKTGMRTIKNMPEQLINTVDEVVEGISKVFQQKPGRAQEASKVGASIDIESDDNIPLRIILLLMDEVFDLKSRNQWLRRRIVTLLRQIVRTMFGDIVNRRILDYVSVITSPKNVAHYLHIFKHSFWPNGMKADKKPERDFETRCRTRIAAKAALLSCSSDELKHVIGSETTRKGLLTIFELFQRPILNRRLLYVLLEGVLCTLFPEKDMLAIFQRLHSKSKRIRRKSKR